jgi:hypothetical protein
MSSDMAPTGPVRSGSWPAGSGRTARTSMEGIFEKSMRGVRQGPPRSPAREPSSLSPAREPGLEDRRCPGPRPHRFPSGAATGLARRGQRPPDHVSGSTRETATCQDPGRDACPARLRPRGAGGDGVRRNGSLDPDTRPSSSGDRDEGQEGSNPLEHPLQPSASLESAKTNPLETGRAKVKAGRRKGQRPASKRTGSRRDGRAAMPATDGESSP